MRTTRQQLEGTARTLAKLCGREFIGHNEDHSHHMAGDLHFEHGPNGYLLVAYSDDAPRHGLSTPFGERLRGPNEMWTTMHFAIRALELAEQSNHGDTWPDHLVRSAGNTLP